MAHYNLPVDYTKLSQKERREVRLQYIEEQNNICSFCNKTFDSIPGPKESKVYLNLGLFPKGFLKYPIHLHHSHDTNLTIGAVHSYCNGVLWQYEGE